MNHFFSRNYHLWSGFIGNLSGKSKCIYPDITIRHYITTTEISTALRPFYFLVHPDLFGQYPRAQHINDASLKSLNNHLDLLVHNRKAESVILEFYVKNKKNDGTLKPLSVKLNRNSAKDTVQNILSTFNLPTKYVDTLPVRSLPTRPDRQIEWHRSYYDATGEIYTQKEFHIKRKESLYSWLIKNMGSAEKKLESSKPIRKDIIRLKYELKDALSLSKLSWQRGLGTTHLRGCMQGLASLKNHYPDVISALKGREVHFGNETGVSLNGSVVLSASEVRDQWLQVIRKVPNEDISICKIPDMQNALSNVLREINVTHRKYQPFVLIGNYHQNLNRLVTALGDYRGKAGFPKIWPQSLSHIQLVVESAAGPLMLSPTGQIITPATCPPSLLINFISENMEEAVKRIHNYEKISKKEKHLHDICKMDLNLDFLEKDDSVSPESMIESLERLLENSYRLAPLLSGARVWVTHYYSVMLDGEICIPWNWE